MSIKSIIIQNKLITILSIGFIAWLAFLLSLLTNNHEIVFYDTLTQVDISSSYTSVNPIFRYIVEPFFTIALVLEMEFSWMFLYLILYPVVRGFFLVFKKRNSSKKLNFILIMMKDMTKFTFKMMVSAVLIVLVIILIGAMTQGFFFINRYFMIPVQIAVHFSMLVIAIKFFYLLIRLVHPGLKVFYRKKPKKVKARRISSSKKFQKVKNELIYYIGIGCLLLGLNIVLISAPFPTHKIIPTAIDDDEFLIDLHVHTVYSDGWLTPEERVLWYIDHGIDIAAFSDHDNLRGAHAAKRFVEDNNLDFTVLIAEEWTDHENDIHINYFGLEEEIVPLESYTLNGPKAMNASDLIQYVKANGGYITVNHYNYDPNPSGGFGMPYSLEDLRDWGVDGFEIVNGGSYGGKYQLIRQFCLDNNLTCVGGSDIHVNEDLNTFIRIRLADPTNKTVENIFQTLQQNLHQVIAIEFAPKLLNVPSEMDDLGFYIFEDFINYLLNVDVCQAISWISWTSGIYVFIVLTYRKFKIISVDTLKEKLS